MGGSANSTLPGTGGSSSVVAKASSAVAAASSTAAAAASHTPGAGERVVAFGGVGGFFGVALVVGGWFV